MTGQQGLALPARLEQPLDGRRLFLGHTLRLALLGPGPVLQHGGGRIGGHGAVLAGVLRCLAFEQIAFQVESESPRFGFYRTKKIRPQGDSQNISTKVNHTLREAVQFNVVNDHLAIPVPVYL